MKNHEDSTEAPFPPEGSRPRRRSFLQGMGAVLAAGTPVAGQPAEARRGQIADILRAPDRVIAFGEEGTAADGIVLVQSGGKWRGSDIEVETALGEGKAGTQLAILVSAEHTRLTRIRLRWDSAFAEGWRYLGDHWERSYGDLEWRGLSGERLMPWYFLASDGRVTHGYGVKTGAASICHWQVDGGGVTLWLDVSNGGGGVALNGRKLDAATVVFRRGHAGESTLGAARAFCRAMCEKPRLAANPVYGSNNWYYAYGRNTSAAGSLADAELMAALVSPGEENRPFVVIDMGWGEARDGAGPVTRTTHAYPDMPALAKRMKGLGVRPGIWTRPTLTSEKRAESWRLPSAGGRRGGDLIVIDPSIPEALEYIAENIRTLRGWGFELIKHDFSTFDLTGRWGFEMGPSLTDKGWNFQNREKTTAEIVLDLYRTIRRSAGDAVLIGCNTIGHLAAGLVEVQRIGDDTSGREWSRTRKMGINAIAFRMAQHNTFFAADADCVPLTGDIPWTLTRQWLDLVARSGAPLFISVDPASANAVHTPALRAALASAAIARQPGEPLDWLDTTIPERWQLGGKVTRYNWYEGD